MYFRSFWSSLAVRSSGHPCTVRSLWFIPCTVSAISGHPLYCVLQSLVTPVLCLQSLVIPSTVSAILVISCTVSAVSGHLLYCVRILWSSPVLCPQSLVISC
ncbi:unnamed protein product, partial [Staurois parvus]